MKKISAVLCFLYISANVLMSQTLSGTITIPGVVTNGIAVVTIGTPMKVSAYPNRPSPLATDLLLLADPVGHTNANINFPQLALAVLGSSSIFANTWPGPTNTLDLTKTPWEYNASTSVAVTGITGSNTTNENTACLTVLNTSATNITFTLDKHIEARDGLRQYTITNGQDFIISIRYAPLINRTNSVNAPQF